MRRLLNPTLQRFSVESTPEVASQLSKLPLEVSTTIRKAAEGLAELALLVPLPASTWNRPPTQQSFSVDDVTVRYRLDEVRWAVRLEELVMSLPDPGEVEK